MLKNMYTQNNDTRKNSEKPLSTWQSAYWIKDQNGEDMRVLRVHVSDDPNSEIYYEGLPEGYKGGATFDEKLEEVYE